MLGSRTYGCACNIINTLKIRGTVCNALLYSSVRQHSVCSIHTSMRLSSRDSPATDDDSDVHVFYPDIAGAIKQIESNQVYEEQDNFDYDLTMDSNAQVWMLSQSMVEGEGKPFECIPSSSLSQEKNNTHESVLRQSAMLDRNASTLAARNARNRSMLGTGFSKLSLIHI